MLNLISAVLAFGHVKGAKILLVKEPKETKTNDTSSKGFFGSLWKAFKDVWNVLDYNIVLNNIQHYTSVSDDYKAEVLEILNECDEKLRALEERYSNKENAEVIEESEKEVTVSTDQP